MKSPNSKLQTPGAAGAETPNSKRQTPEKLQTSNIKPRAVTWSLDVGVWSFLWILDFGI
jgi:hypothetical protein